MLDVHPPHQPAHTWKDFFIHIATIVVGLIIAVGLEQLVERIHQHEQLVELREALHNEQMQNRIDFAADESDWRTTFVELRNNLMVLEYVRQHPGTPQTQLPGVLRWVQYPFTWKHAVWDAAQQNGLVHLLALEEANRDQQYYELMSGLGQESLSVWKAIRAARTFELLDPDPTHLSPVELDQVTELTLSALESHLTYGDGLGLYAHEFPAEPHTITWDTVTALNLPTWERDPQGMAAARKLTFDRLKLANSGITHTTIAPQALR
ncbi:MAG: hypothetical protein HIU91_16435 [Acidobacteria bacterium]|nr:hypothetical protein [Acidobacteriota bacterium]